MVTVQTPGGKGKGKEEGHQGHLTLRHLIQLSGAALIKSCVDLCKALEIFYMLLKMNNLKLYNPLYIISFKSQVLTC